MNTPINDTRAKDFFKVVRSLGAEAGEGKDALPKLAQAVVQAASDGLLTEADAEKVYTEYANAEANKSIYEHSNASIRSQTSKLRQIITLGRSTLVDGVEVLTNAKEIRESMISAKQKVKAAYVAFVDVARAQNKSEVPLSEDEIRELCGKDDGPAKTLEGELGRVLKVLEGIVTGENRDHIKDNHENVEGAYHLIKQ